MSLIKIKNLINTNWEDMLGKGVECGKVGCLEFTHKDTDYCFSHQPICTDCNDTGIKEVTEWVDTDTSYPLEVKCNCHD